MTSSTNSTEAAGNPIVPNNTSFSCAAPVVQESIKLERGMRGAYAWEIRVLPITEGLITDLDLVRLKDLNEKMMKEYGGAVL